MSEQTPQATNQAIVLTPPGAGAIAVIRIVGPAVGGFLSAYFSKPTAPGRLLHGNLIDNNQIIDDPVIFLSSDSSFADINLHAGPWILDRTLDLLTRFGFDITNRTDIAIPLWAAEGSTTLEQEIHASLPLARTDLAPRILLNQLDAWRSVQRSSFPAPSPVEGSVQRLNSILGDRSLHHLLHPPSVAIVGLPNAGKSTLANALFAQEKSITADLPGTTRDWVGDLANLDGLVVHLIDTPGLRNSPDPLEQSAITAAEPVIAAADLVLLLLDLTLPLADQTHLLNRWPSALRIASKCDRPRAWDPDSQAALPTTAPRNEGIDELRRRIRAHFYCDSLDPAEPRIWTSRQREIVSRATIDPAALAEI